MTALQSKIGFKTCSSVHATQQAFAAILADRSVITWGDRDWGGRTFAVQDQLQNVQQVQSTAGAFAAILADGSVATWGNQLWGGNSSAVQDQLRNVQQLQAALYGFAALPVGTSIYSSALTGDRE